MTQIISERPRSRGPREPRGSSRSAAGVVIVGGGIAGLASAWQLAELGARDVLLLEREPLLGSHASGRNAGIFLPLEVSPDAVWLANRSRELLDARIGSAWLYAQGVALVSALREPLDELERTARGSRVRHARWSRATIHRELPLLRGGACDDALHLPLAGVIDVHLVLTWMRRRTQAAGVAISTARGVDGIETERGRVCGVRLRGGQGVATERVVLAAGAWAATLGRAAGSRVALTSLRRHLVHLVGSGMPSRREPVHWRVDNPVYFRPEAGGVLSSPCDEVPVAPCVPVADPCALEVLGGKLERLAPRLAERAAVQRSWACLRTVSEDREPVVGADGVIEGLYWCAGLGGRGMSCGAAAGELLARTMLGLAHPLERWLAPARL